MLQSYVSVNDINVYHDMLCDVIILHYIKPNYIISYRRTIRPRVGRAELEHFFRACYVEAQPQSIHKCVYIYIYMYIHIYKHIYIYIIGASLEERSIDTLMLEQTSFWLPWAAGQDSYNPSPSLSLSQATVSQSTVPSPPLSLTCCRSAL